MAILAAAPCNALLCDVAAILTARPAAAGPPARLAPLTRLSPAAFLMRLSRFRAAALAVAGLTLLATVALGGCLSLHPHVDPTVGAPEMRPDVFFDGPSEGLGTLRMRVGWTQMVRVESRGAYDADSTFRLVQSIRRGEGAPTTRSWTMRRVSPPGAPPRYTGTLTDASGPVDVRVDGGTLRIAYRMGRFLRMEQRLVLQADGLTAVNLSTVSFLGLPVARLFEIIRRAEPVGEAL